MKRLYTLVFLCVVVASAIAQSGDSTVIKSLLPDSLVYITPPVNWNMIVSSEQMPIVTTYNTPIPTCSCLDKRDSLFYEQGDSVPYSGMCVVKYVDNSPDSVDLFSWWSYGTAPPIISATGERVKIVSNYDHGKRHGERQYFDEQGKLLKTEVYEHGVLISTVYPK